MMPPSSGSVAGARFGCRPGDVVGRYQILEKLGEGGMGALFLARDPAIDRLVTVKLLKRGFDTDELRARFACEARAAGRMRHPNIVTVFDVGGHQGIPFMVMEFLAGQSLEQLIRDGARLSLARRLELLEELCGGLAYAHRAGVVHRDIKPGNLIVDSEGVLKILDFGVVRLDAGNAAGVGTLIGTVNYMSPEQVAGGDVDHRSDIFAVGLVAYELLAWRQAFPGDVKEGLFTRILNVDIEPLVQAVPDLDPTVIAIVGRALRRDPDERYQHLLAMREDLARVRARIEAEERAADVEPAPESMDVASAPGGVPAGGPAKGALGLDAAEQAFEGGDYRHALTLAGRLAALNPRDHGANRLMARAEAALLERGRAEEVRLAAARRAAGAGASHDAHAEGVAPAAAKPPNA